LEQLHCSNNQLTTLNISKNTNLHNRCDREGRCSYGLTVSNIPTLSEICVSEIPFPPESLGVDTTGSPNVYFTTDCSSKSLKPDKENGRINIYPNPANDFIVFDLTTSREWTTITIYDIQGKKVIEQRVNDGQVSVQNLPKGLYLYRIDDGKTIYTGKVIKE